MKLVDADKARECFGGDGVTGAVMQRMFDSLPTIDAVPVVRCRECVYAQKKYGHIECSNGISYRNTYNEPNMFCSYGQRKEDDHDKHPSDPL